MDESRQQQERDACNEPVNSKVETERSAGLYKTMLILLAVLPLSFIGGLLGLIVALGAFILAFVTMLSGFMALFQRKSAIDNGYKIPSVVTPAILLISIAFAAVGLNPAIGRTMFWKLFEFHYTMPMTERIVEYRESHDGQLPPAEKWCDILHTESDRELRDYFQQDCEDKWYCNYSMNENAASLGVEAPNDMILLFRSKQGWNQVGSHELFPEDNVSYMRVFLVDGSSRSVRVSDAPYLRWTMGDTGIIPKPPILKVFTTGGLILAGLVIWIIKRWGRYASDSSILLILAFFSLAAGSLLGRMAELLYSISYSRNVGIVVGGVVGLLIGVAYAVILSAVRHRKSECPTMIGYGTMLGAIAGVLCSTLVHAALMIAYAETSFSNLMFGNAIGCLAGVILGWVAGALISGQQKTAEQIIDQSTEE